MAESKRNVLSKFQLHKLNLELDANRKKYEEMTLGRAIPEITKAVQFYLTEANVESAAETVGLSFSKRAYSPGKGAAFREETSGRLARLESDVAALTKLVQELEQRVNKGQDPGSS